MNTRAQTRLHTWLAIAILVLGAVLPSISAAWSVASGDALALQDICSASPVKRGAVDNPALDLLTHGHCAACHAHAAHLAMPPAPSSFVRSDLAFDMPVRFYSAATTSHAWRAAPARAPPLSV